MPQSLAQLTDPGTAQLAQQQALDGMAGRSIATKIGTGTGSISLSGSPAGSFSIVIQIVATGEPGTASFMYSTDGGATLSAIATVPSSGSVALGASGVSVTFAAGPVGAGTSFIANDFWTASVFASALPVLSWQDGTVPKTLTLIIGFVIYNLRQLVALIARGGFVTPQPGITGSSGDWLSLAGQARYGLTRNPATAAQHQVVLTDAANAGPFNITAGQLWVAETVSLGGTNPLRFNNTTGGTLPLGGTLTLTVQAESPGAAYDVGVGTITTLLTPLPGVTVNNPDIGDGTSILVEGVDQESDLAYSVRCIGRWAALGSGSPAAAYDTMARTASSEVTRTRVVADTVTAGQINLTLAGPSGPVSGGAVTAVHDAVLPKVAFPATLNVINASTTNVTVTADVEVFAAQLATAQAACEAALLALFQSVPISGTLYFSQVVEALQGQTGVRNVEISAPLADVSFAVNSVPALIGTRTYIGV